MTESLIKRIFLLIFAVMFIVALPMSMFGSVPKIIPITARGGYFDFTSLQAPAEAVYRLDGEWEYYPNQLLAPSDFDGDIPVRHVSFPHYWQDDSENYPDASGYATYRFVGKKGASSNSVGISSRFQFGAYRIFINGVDLLEVGGVSKNPAEYYVSYRPASAYICPAYGDSFEVIVQIQNYDHVLAGFSGQIFYGSMESLRFFTSFLFLLNGIMIGFLLLLITYFMTVYLQDKSKSLYLDFAVITLMSLYITMTTCNESITYIIAPLISPHILFKLEYITQIIAALFSTRYITDKYMKNKAYSRLIIAVCAAVTAAIIIAPSIEISKLRVQFQVVAFSYYIIPLILTFKEMLRDKTRTALWEFISLLTLLFGVISAKLGVLLWNCVDIFPILMTVYCFIQVVILLYYYSGVEDDLKKLNQTLEQKIEERTKELVYLTQKAESATNAKSDFLALMSHEIRTPMNAIIGMSDLIQTDNLNDTQKLYFRDIKTVSHSLLNIVNDILDFSKVESGKFQILPVHFNFYTMIDNVCSLFYHSASAKSLCFESYIASDIPAVLYGDETRIRQTISNILSNAIKYTAKGSVKFSAERVDDTLLFTVTDTGAGIKEEDLPRLFQLFEQLGRDSSVRGTGLGLSICKQLAELMGGYVSVESEYGEGSTFVVCLPLVEGDPALIEKAELHERVYSDSAAVLVVDDNPINITVAKGILATHNIQPDSAESGMDAIEMAKAKDYDLIFMDHMMPGMDGVETMTSIRGLGGRFEAMPIIALTANAVSGTRESLIRSGMTDFISKPIDRVAMNNILAKWLPHEKLETRKTDESAGLQESPLLFEEFLNVREGLANVGGSAEAYKAVVDQFVYETPAYIDKLNKALADDIKLYSVIVHGIKGSLYSIGADKLGEWALALEQGSRDGDWEACRTQNGGFIEKVYALIDNLKPLLHGDEFKEKRKASLAQLYEFLEPLKTACLLGDCTRVDEIIKSLKELSFGEAHDPLVSEIIELAEHIDYEGAAQRIDEISIQGDSNEKNGT